MPRDIDATETDSLLDYTSLIQDFEFELQKILREGVSGHTALERRIEHTASVLAPVAAITFYFIASTGAKEITKAEWLQKWFITSGVFGSLFSAKFATEASLKQLLSRPLILDKIEGTSRKKRYARNIASAVIASSVATTNFLLASQGDESTNWTIALNACSNIVGAFSMYYGANNLFKGVQYMWQHQAGYFLFKGPEEKKLYKIRHALKVFVNARLSKPYVLMSFIFRCREDTDSNFFDKLLSDDQDECFVDDVPTLGCRSILSTGVDWIAVIIMLSTVTGYVVQTTNDLYSLGAKTHPALGYFISALGSVCSAVGLTGFFISAGLDLRPAIERIIDGILRRNPKLITSAALALAGMSLSGTSGYEANYLTWKQVNETCALVMGYTGLVGTSVVNSVYGVDALAQFLEQMTSCCKTTEVKQQAIILHRLCGLRESIDYIPDAILRDMLKNGEFSEHLLSSAGLRKDIYEIFLPDIPQARRSYQRSNVSDSTENYQDDSDPLEEPVVKLTCN